MSHPLHRPADVRRTWGAALRSLRLATTDPATRKPLTQDALARHFDPEVAKQRISDWERGAAMPHHLDGRADLLTLVQVLIRFGGIGTLEQANEFLLAGRYAPLLPAEAAAVGLAGLPAPQAVLEPRLAVYLVQKGITTLAGFEHYVREGARHQQAARLLVSASDLLADVEQHVRGEVWILSPHLANDVDETAEREYGDFSSAGFVQRNLARGVRYTWLLADTEPVRGHLPRLRALYSGFGTRVRTVVIPPAAYPFGLSLEIALYNPNRVDGVPARAFLQLPLGDGPVWEVSHTWVELRQKAADALAAAARRLIEG